MDWLLPQSRLVVKTALKLLLVFVEYSENNAPLFIQAVNAVASATGQSLSFPFSISQPSLLLLRPPPNRGYSSPFCAAGTLPWANLVSILEEKNGADAELLVYTVTLINKVWNRD